MHRSTDLVPSFNNHTSAKSELKRLISVSAGVELLSVDQGSGVMHGQLIALLGFMLAIGLL